MRTLRMAALTGVTLLGLAWTPAEAGHGSWAIGVNIGGPAYYRPWYGPGYYYYRPYPVYVEPAPVIVQQAPIVMQSPPVVQPVYTAPVSPPVVTRSAPVEAVEPDISADLQQLADPSEQVRADSALRLGRMRATRAIDPLAATLAGDRSAYVREAAARSLALIGSSRALPALQRAALADTDPSVRHTAQFAADVVQSNR